MTRFTRLYLDLDATTATAEKVALLEAYFAAAPDADAAWALALLTGNRPKRAASTNALRTLALERTGVPPWLFDECHAAVGDLSETIALLIPDADLPSPVPTLPSPVTDGGGGPRSGSEGVPPASSPVARGRWPRAAGSEGVPEDGARSQLPSPVTDGGGGPRSGSEGLSPPSSPVARGRWPGAAGSEGVPTDGVPPKLSAVPPHPAPEPLHTTIEHRVLPLITATEDAKADIIRDAWQRMSADERFVYHKLIRGGFRVGVQKRLVTRAIAAVAGVDQKTMAQRLTGTIEPTPHAYRGILEGERDGECILAPLPFFLATQLEEPAGAAEPLAPGALADRLGPADQWLCEWKYDGIRAQLVLRAHQAALWSRGEELISEQFPEILAAAPCLPAAAVLDGEVLVWDDADDRPRPFAELQTRLNRKVAPSLQPGLFDTTRVVFIAYDLLELDGDDLRERPQSERRGLLESTVAACSDDTIRVSPRLPAGSWSDLAAQRARSRSLGVEGLMLKHLAGVYGVGRARSDTGWWKWKVDPYSVDAVLVAAQPGSGRRASLYTDYTFAVRTTDAPDAELVTFAKAYSGLTQDEIEALDRWIRAHTTGKSGPFRSVEPVQVFEIAFEGVRRSARHKSGVAVRFPRIARWRTDKPAAEADTLEQVIALIPGESRR